MELRLVLARIFKKYKLEAAADTVIPPPINSNTGLVIDGGINLLLKSRC